MQDEHSVEVIRKGFRMTKLQTEEAGDQPKLRRGKRSSHVARGFQRIVAEIGNNFRYNFQA